MFNRSLISVAALGLLLTVAGCAHGPEHERRMGGAAQARSDMDHHDMSGHDMGRRGMMRGPGAMTDRLEGRLAFLKAELKITPAQEPRWNGFATAMRDHAKAMGGMHQSMMSQRRPSAALPDRLDGAEKMMTMHRDEMRKMAAAIKPLYATLGPPQRRTANELLGRMVGGPMMGGPRMMGMMGGDRVEGRLAQLRTELKITPAQEPQWNGFAAELRAQSRAMARMHGPMMARMGHDGRPSRRAAANLPASLDMGDKMMAGHIDAMRKFRTVAAALYASLTADQKAVADGLFGRRGSRMGRGPTG